MTSHIYSGMKKEGFLVWQVGRDWALFRLAEGTVCRGTELLSRLCTWVLGDMWLSVMSLV